MDILADSISDAGAWQWWHIEDDMLQLEFCDVQLYDESGAEGSPRTMDAIAIRFSGNVFAVFLDDLDGVREERPWYLRLHDDEIPPFECDAYDLAFDDPEFARSIYEEYRNRTPVTPFRSMDNLTDAKHLIAVKCGEVGVIAGGDGIKIASRNASISEEEIERLSRKWWEYWKEYWRLRGTRDAFPKDCACEVTIPVDTEDPQGFW